MSVGYPTTKSDVDQRAGYLVLTLRDAFDDLAHFKDWLDGRTDADLAALGYDSTDIANLKSGITDLAALGKVGHGQQAQPAANDFFFFAKRLIGLL